MLGVCVAPVEVDAGPPQLPSRPTQLAIHVGGGAAQLSWQAPTSEGASPITGYLLDLGGDGGLVPLSASATTYAAPFPPGSRQTFRLSAVNAEGTGPAAVAARGGAVFQGPTILTTLTSDPSSGLNPPTTRCVGDLNGDGHLDVAYVMPDGYTQQLMVLLGHGDGTFVAMPPMALTVANSCAMGDLDEDGNTDLVVGSESPGGNGGSALYLRGHGDGTFDGPITNPLSDILYNPRAVGVADVNGDGHLDIIDESSDVVLGNGDGTFQYFFTNHPDTNTGPDVALFADVNGDGHVDVLAHFSNWGTGYQFRTALGMPNGTFGQNFTAAPNDVTPEALGDFDRDGRPDVMGLARDANYIPTLYFMHGNCDGTFTVGQGFPVDLSASFAAGDLDGDGRLDVVEFSTSGIFTYFGQGDGTFVPGTVIAGTAANGVTADFNGDGTADVVDIRSIISTSYALSSLGVPGVGLVAPATYVPYDAGLPYYNVTPTLTPMAAVDVNGDGRVDVVLNAYDEYNRVNDLITALTLVDGGLAFVDTGLSTFDINHLPVLAAGDFDEDGVPDVVTELGYIEYVAHGNGDGSFTVVSSDGGIDFQPSGLAAADLDLDGHLDLAGVSNDGFHWARGFGDGGFAPSVVLVPPEQYAGYLAGPVAVTTPTPGPATLVVSDEVPFTTQCFIHLVRAASGGPTVAKLPVSENNCAWPTAAADLDGDGNPELFTAYTNATSMAAVVDGGYVDALSIPVTFTSPLTLADLDGDGRLDLVAGSQSGISVALGLGDGGFGPERITGFGLGDPGGSLLVVDIDGDGVPDLVVSGPNDRTSILLGR
ncbi:MAG: VCBS repeat-containing protein [Deltaproteobacteria bacterium]|nr:VCBS repeat-containing protein [Deltaproteobacteria bacterium]